MIVLTGELFRLKGSSGRLAVARPSTGPFAPMTDSWTSPVRAPYCREPYMFWPTYPTWGIRGVGRRMAADRVGAIQT